MTSLEDALAFGRGEERPFRCPVHGDSNASASVNVSKGVWFCHACHASGRVDDARVPTINELEAMMEPERAVRRYPESWLATFGIGGYWLDRFPEWMCWFAGMGTDPWFGQGTYPVYTRSGTLAGVCRRSVLDEGPKYRYPRGWSASQQLATPRKMSYPGEIVVLVEGYADAIALWEAGISAYACFGAGLHLPQLEHLAILASGKAIALGFDADEAGGLAAERTEQMLDRECIWIDWSEAGAKDPAELDVTDRRAAVLESVSAQGYRGSHLVQNWHTVAGVIKQSFVEEQS